MWSGGIVALMGSVFVHSTLAAQAAPAQFRASEHWRIDGSESGEPFADLRDFVVLRDGSLWALDFKDQNIRRYTVRGKFVDVVGRKGSGPGEMSNANGLVVAPNGMVWMNDARNARINIYRPDGKFERQVLRSPGGSMYRWGAWFDRSNGDLYEMTISSPPRWRRITSKGDTAGFEPYTSCYDGQASAGGYKAETKGQGNMMGMYPFTMGGGVAAVGNGTNWCAAPRATRVALMRSGTKDTIAQTAFEVPLLAVSPAERDNAVADIEKSLSRYATNDFDKARVPRTKPGIAGLHVDNDGRLWVQHAQTFGTRSTTFDVHDAKGKHLGRLTINARTLSHMPMQAQGDQLWLTVLDDDDVTSVVQYRFTR